MKIKVKIGLAVSICVLAFFGFGMTSVLAAPVLHEASEYHTYRDWPYNNRVEYNAAYSLQGDVVYEDASGYTDYAIWYTGTCDYIYDYYSQRIVTYFYISAYYEEHHLWPHQYTIYYWDPIPSGLISWTGDWELHSDYTRWDWTVGGQERYSTGYSALYEYGTKTQASSNSISGDYRYLGYAIHQRDHYRVKGDALIRLHVDNALAEDWADGVFFEEGDAVWKKTIERFQIKIVTKWQYNMWGWHNAHSPETFIFGNGAPSTDLSSIPLVLGTVDGAS